MDNEALSEPASSAFKQKTVFQSLVIAILIRIPNVGAAVLSGS